MDKIKILGFEGLMKEVWRPDIFLRRISSDYYRDIAREYTYIILGDTGPTGKTWLCSELRKLGFNAFEITESISYSVIYLDNRNHYSVDHANKQVVIMLNKRLERE